MYSARASRAQHAQHSLEQVAWLRWVKACNGSQPLAHCCSCVLQLPFKVILQGRQQGQSDTQVPGRQDAKTPEKLCSSSAAEQCFGAAMHAHVRLKCRQGKCLLTATCLVQSGQYFSYIGQAQHRAFRKWVDLA